MVNALRKELIEKENVLEEMKKALKEVCEFSARSVCSLILYQSSFGIKRKQRLQTHA